MPKPNKDVWEKAPKGCTHYNAECCSPYLRSHNGVYYYLVGYVWFKYIDQSYGAEHCKQGVKKPHTTKYKTNKDGWIRHRGGVPKCLNDIAVVKHRDGNVLELEQFSKLTELGLKVFWMHFSAIDKLGVQDVMAYKLKEQPKQ